MEFVCGLLFVGLLFIERLQLVLELFALPPEKSDGVAQVPRKVRDELVSLLAVLGAGHECAVDESLRVVNVLLHHLGELKLLAKVFQLSLDRAELVLAGIVCEFD